VADAELAAIAAGRRAGRGSPEAAEQCLRLAERGMAWVPGTRRAQADLLLGIARLLLARQRGDLPAVAEQAQRKQDAAEAAQPGLGRGGAGAPGRAALTGVHRPGPPGGSRITVKTARSTRARRWQLSASLECGPP
jgi:hypothetical protein